jgi:enoyl-CoA hydratase/carnithine racemase
MEMILTGAPITAQEAEKFGKESNQTYYSSFMLMDILTGLVSRTVPAAKLMEEAMKVAEAIGTMSQPVSKLNSVATCICCLS